MRLVHSFGSMAPDDAILSDIVALLNDVGCGSCHFIPGFGNKAAHTLASITTLDTLLILWTL